MSDTTQQQQPGAEGAADKGKGKAIEQIQDDGMEEDDSSSEDEAEAEVEVAEEEDDDNMEEISTENILGKRTRGKKIDYEKAAEQAGDELPDDDEDDDDDFEEPDQEMEG